MKKHFNKLLSLVIATVIILTFSAIPAFASSSPPTTWTPTSDAAAITMKQISANNVSNRSGVTVTAYQIVKGKYKDGKLTGYTLCDGLASIPDIDTFNYVSPTSDWIAKIANYIEGHPTAFDSVQMNGSYGSYRATVEAGEYIILVRKSPDNTGSLQRVYNPAIVAVNVTDANLINISSSSGGSVSMNSQFSAGDTAYMKSGWGYISKKIVIDANTNSNLSTASYGDTVNFCITCPIQSYSEDYASPLIFKITDDLYLDHSANPPFLGVSGLTVKVGTVTNGVFTGSELPEVTGEGAEAVRNYTVTYYDKDGNEIQNLTAENLTQAVKYEIEFADSFIRANGKKNVEITYSTTFTDNAKLAVSESSSDHFVSNETRATQRYSNDPTNKNSYYEDSSETEIYTFGIDSGNGTIQTYELNKVTQAGGTYTSVLDNNDAEITKKSPYALAGATFTLYSDSAMTQEIGTATSDANGHIEFRGLGPGTYYIKETAAPSGYTLNENDYKIVISALLGQDGFNMLNSYTITTYLMGETDTQVGLAKYERLYDYTTNTYKTVSTVTPAEVVNTTLATLPTTGGVGTIVISIVAGLGMAVFLTIFVISKKKKAKKN